MIALAVDAILALVVVEAVTLTALYAKTGRGIRPQRLLANLAAGFCLMLAVRLALGDGRQDAAVQALIGAVLLGALMAHVLDLVGRWQA